MALHRDESREVIVIVDRKIAFDETDKVEETKNLLFHPMVNMLSLRISAHEFHAFLACTSHADYRVMDLE